MKKKVSEQMKHDLDSCNVSSAQQALKSKFARDLFDRLSNTTHFSKKYLESVMEDLLDESAGLTKQQADDFLDFIELKNQYFDELVQRYIGRFPAWVQSRITKFSNDMQRQDHILYRDGKYVSLDKIKTYVKSRIRVQNEEVHTRLNS